VKDTNPLPIVFMTGYGDVKDDGESEEGRHSERRAPHLPQQKLLLKVLWMLRF